MSKQAQICTHLQDEKRTLTLNQTCHPSPPPPLELWEINVCGGGHQVYGTLKYEPELVKM